MRICSLKPRVNMYRYHLGNGRHFWVRIVHTLVVQVYILLFFSVLALVGYRQCFGWGRDFSLHCEYNWKRNDVTTTYPGVLLFFIVEHHSEYYWMKDLGIWCKWSCPAVVIIQSSYQLRHRLCQLLSINPVCVLSKLTRNLIWSPAGLDIQSWCRNLQYL